MSGLKGKEPRIGGPRPDGPRPPRGDRPFGDRPERSDKTVKFSSESREERNNRQNREDRPVRSDNDFFSRFVLVHILFLFLRHNFC